MNASQALGDKMSASPVSVIRRGAHLGAEITGVDLAHPLSDVDFAVIEDAFVENEVLFFRDQDITLDQYVAFARPIPPTSGTATKVFAKHRRRQPCCVPSLRPTSAVIRCLPA